MRREEAHLRRAQRVTRQVVPDADVADEVAAGIDMVADRAEVRTALGELPPDQREVVSLMYYGGMTQSAISEKLGLPLGTVKSRCLLAMRRLRSALVREDAS